jgi:hypothetical protein
MGNVDGVPVASQVKSAVQAARGEREAAWRTQQRFTEQCVGAAQIRSLVEISRGDAEAAAQTQRRFLETARRVLGRSDIADALPGVAQLKSTALENHGEVEAAERTRRNFSARCPGVSQAQSLYEAIAEDRHKAVERQREFVEFAGSTMDKVPLLGHAKGLVHHAVGDHHRGEQALDRANRSVTVSVEFFRMAFHDIATAESSQHVGDGELPEGLPNVEVAGPLTPTQIRHSTHRFIVTNEQCSSFTACPICMQDFVSGDVGTTLRCFHIFHAACAETWLQQNGNCPVCRIQAHETEMARA